MLKLNGLSRLVFGLAAALPFTLSPALADENHRIPLKLFGKDVIEDYDGCSFALWQSDKTPGESKFPYVFFAPIHDGGELPGWMQIGDKVYEFERQDTSEGSPDYVAPNQLYKTYEGDNWVILKVIEQRVVGNDIIIDKAELTTIQPKKFPFVSVVKGKYGCPASAYEASNEQAPAVTYTSLDGDPISLSVVGDYDDLFSIPAGMRRHVTQNYESCDLEQVAPYSTEYAISSAMSLWVVPCALYASNATSNFFTVLNDNLDYFAPVYTNHPSGLAGFENGDLKELLNASVFPETGTIIAYENSTAGDCGSYWKYQLRAVEGEAVEAFLAEYRRKDNCDGVYTEPENMPIIYQAD